MRIVSLAPSNTEILYSLGVEPVAVTRFCDYPAEAMQKPKVGGWIDVNEQLVREQKPDLILTSTFVQDKIAQNYSELGFEVLPLNPRNLEDVYHSIEGLGRVVNKEHEARWLAYDMRNSLKEIEQANSGKRKLRVYCEEWHEPPHVSGNWVPEIIEIAGGTGMARAGVPSYPIFLSQVEEFNPDCIILSLCRIGESLSRELFYKRKGWQNLRATRQGKVFAINDSLLNRPAPRLVHGARRLAEILDEVRG